MSRYPLSDALNLPGEYGRWLEARSKKFRSRDVERLSGVAMRSEDPKYWTYKRLGELWGVTASRARDIVFRHGRMHRTFMREMDLPNPQTEYNL